MKVENPTLRRIRMGGIAVGTLSFASTVVGCSDVLGTLIPYAAPSNGYELKLSPIQPDPIINKSTVLFAGVVVTLGAFAAAAVSDGAILKREETATPKLRQKGIPLFPDITTFINGIEEIDNLPKKQ